MKKFNLFVASVLLVALVSFGFVLADGDNSTGNSTDNSIGNETGDFNGTIDDFECVIDSDCKEEKICLNRECEKNKTHEDDDDEHEGKKDLGYIIRGRVKAGVYTSESGETIRVSNLAKNKILLSFGNEEGDTELEVEEEAEEGVTKLEAKLKDGRNAEIKIMPEVASEKALEKLKLKTCSEENNCKMELREIEEGGKMKLSYDIQIERDSKILGVFKKKMKVETQIDAGSGEILLVDKPWWAWLAMEPSEE